MADSYVQLLTPIRDDSPVAKYLERNGRGPPPRGLPGGRLRRRADAVTDGGGAGHRRRRRARGPRGTTVAFVHPKTAFGTLIELVEE